MRAALWVVASGWEASTLLGAIPPACRGAVDAPGHAHCDDGEALVDTRVWPAMGATHFVPSFAAHSAEPFSVRLELSVRVAGEWSPWVAGVGLGPARFGPAPAAGPLDVDVDVFRARAPVEAVRLRLRLRAAAPASILAAPWMLSLSTWPTARPPGSAATAAPPSMAVRLDVPARSQMEAGPAIGSRICSPTCVAMLLDFWERSVDLGALATEIFHPATDLYGVWPAAILAGGRRGLGGYLLRFPDWAAAQWCLARGLPVVASVRYEGGELEGAAIPRTAGHLVVLRGWEGQEVLVNDPAAPAAGSVPRRYRRDQLCRVWLERNAVGYVLFPPGATGEASPVTGA
jgi:hypothetical protein